MAICDHTFTLTALSVSYSVSLSVPLSISFSILLSLLWSLFFFLCPYLSRSLSLSLDLYIYLFPTKKKTRGYFLLSGSLCTSGCSDFSVSLFICASRSAVFLFIHLLPARKRGWQRISESCDGSVDLNPQQAPLLSVKKKKKETATPIYRW